MYLFIDQPNHSLDPRAYNSTRNLRKLSWSDEKRGYVSNNNPESKHSTRIHSRSFSSIKSRLNPNKVSSEKKLWGIPLGCFVLMDHIIANSIRKSVGKIWNKSPYVYTVAVWTQKNLFPLLTRPQGSQGSQGCQKIPFVFLQMKLFSFCAKIAPKRHKLQKPSKLKKKCQKTLFY